MKVPFFDYPQLYKKDKLLIDEKLDLIMNRGAFILQNDLVEFEKKLAKYTGAKHALGVANGTDAIWLSVMACGLKPGDEVLMPSHTYVATPAAVNFLGITPILVDCSDDHLMCLDDLNKKISSHTKAVMPVQLNGRTLNMDQLNDIATKNDLIIIEDAAQGLGSKFKGKMAGTFGIAGTYSFYPAKTLGCFGDGGAIVTNDTGLYKTLYELRDHGRDEAGNYKRWGLNSRLDNMQAGILLAKLEILDNEIKRRREIANLYHDALSAFKEIKLPPKPDEESAHFDTFQNYEIDCNDRDNLKSHLASKDVGTIIQWGGKAIHQIKALNLHTILPKTDKLFEGCLLLPMNTTLTNQQVEYVIDSIIEFYA